MESMGNEPILENRPIMENQPVLQTPSPSPKKFSAVVAVVISVVATVAIVCGGICFWQNVQLKTAKENLISVQNSLTSTERSSGQRIAVLEEQIAQLETEKDKSVTTSDQYVALTDELNETKFKLALTSRNAVSPSVFADPQNKNRFYFITQADLNEGGSYQNIWYYDFMKDSSFQKDGTIDITVGRTLVYKEKVTENWEFRGLGIVDNKFIFAETHFEDTPAICATPWISYNKMYYIDLGVENSNKKDYTLSEEQGKAEQKKVDDCQKSLQ